MSLGKERNHSKSRVVNAEGYKAETMVWPQGENLSTYLQTLFFFFSGKTSGRKYQVSEPQIVTKQ